MQSAETRDGRLARAPQVLPLDTQQAVRGLAIACSGGRRPKSRLEFCCAPLGGDSESSWIPSFWNTRNMYSCIHVFSRITAPLAGCEQGMVWSCALGVRSGLAP